MRNKKKKNQEGNNNDHFEVQEIINHRELEDGTVNCLD